GEQADRELTPDDRADLAQGLRRLEMIETARQRSLQGRGDAGIGTGSWFCLPGRASLDDRSDDLLDKERHAVRPGGDALDEGGTELRACVGHGERRTLGLVQAMEGQIGYMISRRPFGTERGRLGGGDAI